MLIIGAVFWTPDDHKQLIIILKSSIKYIVDEIYRSYKTLFTIIDVYVVCMYIFISVYVTDIRMVSLLCSDALPY